ncbi:MAG: hypothetical protein WDN28_09535 [Chthoniobacter sp.]
MRRPWSSDSRGERRIASGGADGFREIQVLSGVIWLTTTPAEGDTLLRAADRFSPAPAWPVVFEALQDASLLLLR